MRATIAFNRRVSAGYRHLGIASPGFLADLQAGRFVMVRPPQVGVPFLPRAFSLYRLSRTSDATPVIEILFKIVGRGTQYLAALEPGQELDLLGPLGNSFTPPPPGGSAVLVAGGIGVPPIAALARSLAPCEGSGVRGQGSGTPAPASGLRPPVPCLEVFLGGKTHEDILCVDDFETLGIKPHITTEDGSLGTKGLITDLLGPFLITCYALRVTLYTCGPPGMLAAVARLAEKHGIPCQASVEANMACGFGACMGCAIEIRSQDTSRQYKLVCKDGPVFDAREIKWGWEGESLAPRGCGCHEP